MTAKEYIETDSYKKCEAFWKEQCNLIRKNIEKFEDDNPSFNKADIISIYGSVGMKFMLVAGRMEIALYKDIRVSIDVAGDIIEKLKLEKEIALYK